MLEIRSNCECCDSDLAPDAEARICSFECTYCIDCADRVLAGVCPNCAGVLVARPIRPAALLTKHPPSARRVLKEGGCAPLASGAISGSP